MAIKRAICNVLVSFALISIGFALGKETTRRTVPTRDAAAAPAGAAAVAPVAGAAATPVPAGGDDWVVVYYMHATIRCVTCLEIEASILSILQTDFADELAEGRIEWRPADYQTDEALAKRYDVGSGCVVVVKVKDGREGEFKKLDDIWTRSSDRAWFSGYLGSAIRPLLGGG